MKSCAHYTALAGIFLLVVSGCKDAPPPGFELAVAELERLNLCIDFENQRSLVGPSIAYPSKYNDAEPSYLEIWISKVRRTDKNGQPDYIRPEMANKMVDYPFTYRTYKPEFRAAFLVVAKAGQNFNAEALHQAIQSGKPLAGCKQSPE